MKKDNSDFFESDIESILEPIDEEDSIRQLVPLDKIEFDPGFHYKNINRWYIKRISKALRHGKRITPVVLSPHKDGFRVVRGSRRVVAAAEAGFEEIPAIIRKDPGIVSEESARDSAQQAGLRKEKKKKIAKTLEEKKEVLHKEAIKPNRQARSQKSSIDKLSSPIPEVDNQIPKKDIKDIKEQSQPSRPFSVPLLPDLDQENQELKRTISYLSHENENAQQELKKMRSEVSRFRLLINRVAPEIGESIDPELFGKLKKSQLFKQQRTFDDDSDLASKFGYIESSDSALDQDIHMLQKELHENQRDSQKVDGHLNELSEKSRSLEAENKILLLKIDEFDEKLTTAEARYEKSLEVQKEKQREIDKIIAENEILKSEIERLTQKKSELEIEINSVQEERKMLRDHITSLEEDIDIITEDRDLIQAESERLSNKIVHLEKKIADQEKNKSKLEKDILELKKKLVSAESKLDQVLKGVNEKQSELEEAIDKKNKVEVEMEKMIKVKEKLERELFASRTDRNNWKSYAEDIEEELKNIAAEGNISEAKSDHLSRKIVRLEEKIAHQNKIIRLEEKIAHHEKDKFNLEEKILKLSSDLQQLQEAKLLETEEKNKLDQELSQLKERLNIQHEELSFIQKEKVALAEAYQKSQEEKEKIRNKFQKLKEEKVHYVERFKKLQQQVKNNRLELEEHKDKLDKANEKIKDYKVEKMRAVALQDKLEQEVKRLERVKDKLHKNYVSLELKLDQVESEKAEAVEKNKELKAKTITLQESFYEARKKIKRLTKEKENLYRYISDLISKNDRLAKTIDELYTKINSYKQNINTYKQKSVQAKQSIEKLTRSEIRLNFEIKKINEEKNQLISRIEKKKNDESIYQRKIDKLNSEKKLLLSEQAKLRKELKVLREREYIDGIFNGLSKLQEKQKKLQETEKLLEAAKVKLRQFQKVEIKKEIELNELKDILFKAKAKIKSKVQQIEQVKAEKLSLKAKINEYRVLEGLVIKLKQDLQKKKVQNINLSDELNKVKTIAVKLKDRNQNLRDNLIKAKAIGRRLYTEKNELNSRIEKLIKNIYRLKRIISTLEKGESELIHKLDLHQEASKVFSKRIISANEEKVVYSGRLEDYKSTLNKYIRKKRAIEKELAGASTEVKMLRGQLKDFQEREKSLLGELNTSKETINKLSDQLVKLTTLQGVSNEERSSLAQTLKEVSKEKEELEQKLMEVVNYTHDNLGTWKFNSSSIKRNRIRQNIPKDNKSNKPH